MSTATVKMNKSLEIYLDKALTKNRKGLVREIKKTSLMGISDIKRTYPKQSGMARKAFTIQKKSDLSYEIKNDLNYIASLEFGAKAKVITPKRGKFLLFTTKPNKRTKSGSIKQAAKRAFFNKLKETRTNKERYSVMKQQGIFLSKKVNQKARAGKFLIKNVYKPKISRHLTKGVLAAIKKAF
tara:strand:+ start:192 stop:740 length:549 start_codon:yes stop_codon:yes gene_type:complete